MCHFITLIAPTTDATAVLTVMKRHGRAAAPIDNRSIRKVLREGEHQYLTTSGHCDCGTILGQGEDSSETEARLAKETDRMLRKGWSEAKIARALEDQRKVRARPSNGGHDSIGMWCTVLQELGKDLKLPHAGLLVRCYSGRIDSEVFAVSRRDAPKTMPRDEALLSMREDEVTVFRLG
jgi:hypothetical protein